MKTPPLLLAACLAAAVALAGCAGNDDESTGGGDAGSGQTGRELSTDVTVEDNGTANSTMETNESDPTTNSTG